MYFPIIWTSKDWMRWIYLPGREVFRLMIRGDAFRFLQGAQADSFDFIFADPPYALEDFQEVPKRVLERNLLREGGIFVMEHSKQYDFSALPYFQQHRVYGSVNFSIFIREEAKTDA